MNKHINIEYDGAIPWYAIHKDGLIAGFFGIFRFLSNFYPLENAIVADGLYYPSVEHVYQAMKWPCDQRSQFLNIPAWKAKNLGRKAPNFDAKKWNKNKYELMYSLVIHKFLNNEKLMEKLLATEGFQLEERNSWSDTDWGTNEQGIGENNLGKILMKFRDNIKEIKDTATF